MNGHVSRGLGDVQEMDRDYDISWTNVKVMGEHHELVKSRDGQQY